jgi:protein AbiQ
VNVKYQRPYIGVLLNIDEKQYFAPLTSSKKGKKLKNNPIMENITFLPIENCKYGGINFNNMIPVIESVYWAVDMDISEEDDTKTTNRKIMLQKQIRFIRKNKEHIIIKAKYLYNLTIENRLYPNQKPIVCDFIKLEKAASKYKPTASGG